jgi:hypothetical protein
LARGKINGGIIPPFHDVKPYFHEITIQYILINYICKEKILSDGKKNRDVVWGGVQRAGAAGGSGKEYNAAAPKYYSGKTVYGAYRTLRRRSWS